MRFSTFLKDKWIFLLSQTGIILFLALLLNVMKISNAANALVCICILFITVGALVLEYNQKNGFYRELYRNLGTFGEEILYLISNGKTWICRGCNSDGCIKTDYEIDE